MQSINTPERHVRETVRKERLPSFVFLCLFLCYSENIIRNSLIIRFDDHNTSDTLGNHNAAARTD